MIPVRRPYLHDIHQGRPHSCRTARPYGGTASERGETRHDDDECEEITIRHVPNLLSTARIVLSLSLAFIHDSHLFLVIYLICGLTDVLDGFIARRCHAQTDRGAKLDSLGDLVFWITVLILLYTRTHAYTDWVVTGMALIVIVRMANAAITRVKFRQWGMLHSTGNKLAGLMLFPLCLSAFMTDGIPWPLGAAALVLTLFSAIEETTILLRSRHYNPDPQGCFDVPWS